MYIGKNIRAQFESIADMDGDTPLLSFKLGFLRGICIFYKNRMTLRRLLLPSVTIYYKDAALTFTKPAGTRYKKLKHTFTFTAPHGKIYIDGRRFTFEEVERLMAFIEKISSQELNDSVYKSELKPLLP